MVHKIFIDSSAFIALYDKRDQFHQQASTFLFENLNDLSIEFFTSNLVVSESYTRLLYRTNFQTAINFLEALASTDTKIIYSDLDTEEIAKALLIKYSNLKLSYTDAVSFSIMRKNNIENAFTFDKHFQNVGIKIFPSITH